MLVMQIKELRFAPADKFTLGDSYCCRSAVPGAIDEGLSMRANRGEAPLLQVDMAPGILLMQWLEDNGS
jgi:hypothetical protein